MTVLLLGVMAGLATLARGVFFTLVACIVLLGSVFVLYGSLVLAGVLGAPTWVRSVLALLVFVLVVGGGAHFLTLREPAPFGDDTDDGTAIGDGPATDDSSTGDAVTDGAPTDDADGTDDADDAPQDDESQGTPGG